MPASYETSKSITALSRNRLLRTASKALISAGSLSLAMLIASPVSSLAADTIVKEASPTSPATNSTGSASTVTKNAAGEPSMVLISAPAIIAEMNQALTVGFNGDLDKGISLMDEVIKKAPGMALAYNDRGMLYYRANKLKLADADLNKALELDSSDSQYWSNRGLIRMMEGMEPDALSDLDKAISMSRKNVMALATRGAIYMRQGSFAKAKDDFDVALEADPKSALNLNNRAMTKFQTGDQQGAIEDAEKALALEPNSEIMKGNLTLFKTKSPGQISVKAEAEYAVKNGHLGHGANAKEDKSGQSDRAEQPDKSASLDKSDKPKTSDGSSTSTNNSPTNSSSNPASATGSQTTDGINKTPAPINPD